MDKFVITGNGRLKGTVPISGAKNAGLPIMAASLLAEGPSVLHGVPDLADIRSMTDLLQDLGSAVSRDADGALRLLVEDEGRSHAGYERVRKMRASICVLGPLLAKRKQARVSMPGGCAIGSRPVDLHLKGMEALGAHVEINEGYIEAEAPNGLTGCDIVLDIASVGATFTGVFLCPNHVTYMSCTILHTSRS